MITTSPKGTEDLLPQDSYKWHYLERKFARTAALYNYKEIRVPTFEHTELFERGVGDTTDVVEKQMYTFNDKGGRSVTLRPEGTASVVRSFLQNSLYALPMPMKMYYNIACFRYENKQKGRLREFHQFGVEAFGAENPTLDAEVISLALTFLGSVGLKELSVNINSIGCPTCRKAYSEALKDYLRPHYDELCDTCKSRFERNPLRIIDCKSEQCQSIVAGAPRLLDYICEDCRSHFEAFKACLDGMRIEYTIDPGIVRGLDYYTKTVFEIISGDFTVCGGGRYDGLVEELGGKPCPAIGFGLGIERLLLRLEETGVEIPKEPPVKIYIAPLGEKAVAAAQGIVYSLRREGISADTDHMGRGLRASMKYADKLGAEYTAVLGDNEIETGEVNVKNMTTGEQTAVKLGALAGYLK
ncbi:MAG TPA: histidine--tRNA ligase [Candidatus Ornithomonoglobus merdipullorum]|uniref:Histidine--tRNA ligase n=1 Tax=Candidatus Ornithomonoglobus merdipullorum TaxID=2840895 RepID=A0A9D1MA50_9FIRM|nr:histidine--tRNA ligase [Candidatus Ornithomonoglobus merdipullorum]